MGLGKVHEVGLELRKPEAQHIYMLVHGPQSIITLLM